MGTAIAMRQIRWGLVVAAALLTELSVIAIFFLLLLGATLAGVPEIASPLSPLDYADALLSSFVMVFIFTLWLGTRVECCTGSSWEWSPRSCSWH
jgi:hypothetical protein